MRRRWVCDHCHRTLRARIEVKLLFHECTRPRRPRRPVPLPRGDAETMDEIRQQIWSAFAEALPSDALLRRTG